MNLHYRLIKELAISLVSLGIPLSFCAGYLVGEGRWQLGLVLMFVYMVIDNISGRLTFWVWENLRGK